MSSGLGVFCGRGNIEHSKMVWERNGSVVECLTQYRGDVGSSLTDITALCS